MKLIIVLFTIVFISQAEDIQYEIHEKPNGKSFCAKLQGEGEGKLIVKRSVCDENPSRLIPITQYLIYPPEGDEKSEYCMEMYDRNALKKVEMAKCEKFQKDFPYLAHNINQK